VFFRRASGYGGGEIGFLPEIDVAIQKAELLVILRITRIVVVNAIITGAFPVVSNHFLRCTASAAAGADEERAPTVGQISHETVYRAGERRLSSPGAEKTGSPDFAVLRSELFLRSLSRRADGHYIDAGLGLV
jgi:hypothetical protein